jgi:hypothetical protein
VKQQQRSKNWCEVKRRIGRKERECKRPQGSFAEHALKAGKEEGGKGLLSLVKSAAAVLLSVVGFPVVHTAVTDIPAQPRMSTCRIH